MDLDELLGASDDAAPVAEEPETVEATGAATGLALADNPVIPMVPVSESSNPPTDGDELETTSGSTISPVIRSPMECATKNALKEIDKMHLLIDVSIQHKQENQSMFSSLHNK